LSYPRQWHRIGREPNPLSPTVVQRCGLGRFDDPYFASHNSFTGPVDPTLVTPPGHFRTRYFGETRLACFLEVLQDQRPALDYLEHLAVVASGGAPIFSGIALRGKEEACTIHRDEFKKRRIQGATLPDTLNLLDLRTLEERQALRGIFHTGLQRFINDDVNLSTVTSLDRPFTQFVAQHAYQQGYDGMLYTCRFGTEHSNLALFEHAPFTPLGTADEIEHDDPDLLEAVRLFRLRREP